MTPSSRVEAAVARWHDAVNAADLPRAREAVTDPVVVNGPKGARPISPDGFAGWITRSGIRLRPRSHHPVGDRLLVVEQDAVWPDDPAPARVATVFRVAGDRVSAALRFPALRDALEFAALYRALAATEHP